MAEIVISLLILAGAFFILVAAIGIVRFRDLYGRLHATTKATSFGLLLMLLGVCLFFNLAEVYLKTVLILLFIYLTAPLPPILLSVPFLKSLRYHLPVCRRNLLKLPHSPNFCLIKRRRNAAVSSIPNAEELIQRW